jgi:hypothetical protein
MRPNAVSQALRDRLGHDATVDLLELFETKGAAWSDRVLSIAAERFERRLAEEIASLRVAVIAEIHAGRVETLKWAFVFWIGQLAAFAGLLAFMLRSVRP